MSFVIKVLKGEYPLVKTFWIVGFIGNGIFGFLLKLSRQRVVNLAEGVNLFEIDYMNFEDPLVKAAFVAATIFSLATIYLFLSYVAVWKSANRYKGNKNWARLAKIALFLGFLDIFIEI